MGLKDRRGRVGGELRSWVAGLAGVSSLEPDDSTDPDIDITAYAQVHRTADVLYNQGPWPICRRAQLTERPAASSGSHRQAGVPIRGNFARKRGDGDERLHQLPARASIPEAIKHPASRYPQPLSQLTRTAAYAQVHRRACLIPCRSREVTRETSETSAAPHRRPFHRSESRRYLDSAISRSDSQSQAALMRAATSWPARERQGRALFTRSARNMLAAGTTATGLVGRQ